MKCVALDYHRAACCSVLYTCTLDDIEEHSMPLYGNLDQQLLMPPLWNYWDG